MNDPKNSQVCNDVGIESEIHILLDDDIADGTLQTKGACMLAAAVRELYGSSYSNDKQKCPYADLVCRRNEFLPNGARIYLDHAYLEYSTPLSRNTAEAVAVIQAGDQIIKSAVQSISRNPFAPFMRSNHKTITSLEIQRALQDYFSKLHDLGVFRYRVPDAAEILARWEQVLTKLERYPFELVGSLDWISKFVWLEQIRNHKKLQWNDPQMQWLDILYHNITGGQAPNVPSITINSQEKMNEYVRKAPKNSREELRGKLRL